MTTEVSNWVFVMGAEFAAEVDRLWPDENDPGYRAQCLSEEAGEVSRAITKRRHALNSGRGKCKGLTPNEWSDNLRTELAQTIGVAFDIAFRENIDIVAAVYECLNALREREPDS